MPRVNNFDRHSIRERPVVSASVSNFPANPFAHYEGDFGSKFVLLIQRRRFYAVLFYKSFGIVQSYIMSSWNGFDDGDANSEHSTPLSSRSSPFSTTFRTPPLPGIETGVREVPRTVSEHPEVLYDALEIRHPKPQPDRSVCSGTGR